MVTCCCLPYRLEIEMGKDEMKTMCATPWVRLFKLFILASTKWVLGLRSSIFGTLIPSLETYFDTPLSILSGLFLVYGIGSATACVLTAFVYKWIHVTLLLALAVFMVGSGSTLFLWSRNIIFGFVCHTIIAAGSGTCMNGVYSYVNALFPEESYPFHVLTICASFGFVIGPIITKYFLDAVPSGLLTLEANSSGNTMTNATAETITSSSVFYLYTVVGVLSVPLVIAYCSMFLKERGQETNAPQEHHFTEFDGKFTWSELCFIGLILFMSLFVFGIGFTHGQFITTIAEKGHLQLSSSRATSLTSFFWAVLFLGRSCGLGLSMIVKQIIIMYVCLLGSIASVVVLIVSVYRSEIYFWVGTLSLGLFSGPQSATLLAWSREFVPLTPLLIGMINVLDYVGMTVLPFIAGELFSWKSEIIDFYFYLCVAISTLFAFCFAHCISKFKLK